MLGFIEQVETALKPKEGTWRLSGQSSASRRLSRPPLLLTTAKRTFLLNDKPKSVRRAMIRHQKKSHHTRLFQEASEVPLHSNQPIRYCPEGASADPEGQSPTLLLPCSNQISKVDCLWQWKKKECCCCPPPPPPTTCRDHFYRNFSY